MDNNDTQQKNDGLKEGMENIINGGGAGDNAPKGTPPELPGGPKSSESGSKELLSPLVIEAGEDEEGGMNTEELIQNIKFYLFPIGIFVFFIIVVVFFIVRPIQDLGQKFTEIDEKEQRYEELGETLDDLRLLTETQQADIEFISKIESLVPTNSTRVIEFRDRLNDIAVDSGLEVDGINASENLQSDEENPFVNLTNAPLFIIEIPAELTATGTLQEFQTFLSNLYLSSDFFVVNEMSISKSTLTEDSWKAEFILVKYQFGGSANLPPDLSTFIVGQPIPEVVEFIERKFGAESVLNDEVTIPQPNPIIDGDTGTQ